MLNLTRNPIKTLITSYNIQLILHSIMNSITLISQNLKKVKIPHPLKYPLQHPLLLWVILLNKCRTPKDSSKQNHTISIRTMGGSSLPHKWLQCLQQIIYIQWWFPINNNKLMLSLLINRNKGIPDRIQMCPLLIHNKYLLALFLLNNGRDVQVRMIKIQGKTLEHQNIVRYF